MSLPQFVTSQGIVGGVIALERGLTSAPPCCISWLCTMSGRIPRLRSRDDGYDGEGPGNANDSTSGPPAAAFREMCDACVHRDARKLPMRLAPECRVEQVDVPVGVLQELQIASDMNAVGEPDDQEAHGRQDNCGSTARRARDARLNSDRVPRPRLSYGP